MITNFVTLADEAAKMEIQNMKGFVYCERKFWTPSARDQGSELPSSSETELV